MSATLASRLVWSSRALRMGHQQPAALGLSLPVALVRRRWHRYFGGPALAGLHTAGCVQTNARDGERARGTYEVMAGSTVGMANNSDRSSRPGSASEVAAAFRQDIDHFVRRQVCGRIAVWWRRIDLLAHNMAFHG